VPDPNVLASAIDWTPVIVACITLAGVIFTGLCQLFFFWYIKPPSGGRLGRMMEQVHANSSATVAAVTGLQEDTNGTTTHPPAYEAGTPPSER
jgi:hypothetical protein